MLDLLRSRHGHNHASHTKSGIREPTTAEVVPTPVFEQPNPHDVLAELREPATPKQAALLSPAPSIGNYLSVSKRQSSFARAFGSVRASYGRFTNTVVRDQHHFFRQKCQREFGKSIDEHFFNTSFEGLLEWIRSERMMSLPHKGGTWDRVLIAAQYFAEQVYHFNRHIELFTEDSGAATNFVFGQCVLLLGIGHENASALEKAFDLFYQFGLELSPLIGRADLFTESQTIMEGVGRAFADLLQIVAGTSITFYQAVHSGRPFTKIDIFASFSVLIDTFRLRVHACSHEMWNVALALHNTDGCQVDVLQRWLVPEDSVLAFLSSNHINVACRPEQFTCNWFQSHLTGFLKSREKILLVEGKSGSGKTTLATWVVNRLQRQIARKHVSTISFFFDSEVVAQSTPLAMLRTLLNQLLSIRIGNLRLFEAANEAYMESKKLNAEEQEAVMWRALSKALQAVGSEGEDSIAIVIDGIESDAIMQQPCKKLHELAQKYAGVRLIQFSQPLSQNPTSAIRVKLSLDNILDDIRTVIRRRLHTYEHFKDREVGDQESIVEQIATAADGSILWSYLACKFLLRQSSCKGFDETLKTLTTSSTTVLDVVKKLYVSLDLHDDCKVLLSLLVIAVRPLRVVEAEALLNTADKSVDVKSMLSHLSSLTIITEGLVSIRHHAVKQAILGLTVDAHLAHKLKVGHQDMLMRLFASTASSLRVEQEPSLTCLERVQAESKLQAHPLLEYAIRYWTLHFKKSPIFKAQGDLQVPNELKNIFPRTVFLCLLEQACWNAQSFSQEALEMHMIAFRVRKTLFGQDHACVLQSAAYCAMICETLPSRLSEAIEWYALAAKISSVVVGVQAEITVTCCNVLLRISETSITKKRTTVMSYREQVLLILVSSYKHRYGSSSKEVLEIYEKLRELYVHIEEETKLTEALEIIQKLTVIIYGSHSHEAQLISRKAQVLLKGHQHKPELDTMHGFLFHGYTEEREESLTVEYIKELIERARKFISHGEFVRAEEVYIELWLKLSEHCHTVHVCEWHEQKIQIMLEYAQFLRVYKRESEASSILVAIWTEYEHHEFCMFESIVTLLKEVAVCMLAVNLLTVALQVFNKCYWFFKHQHKEHLAIFKEISEKISQTSTEISEKSTTISIETSSETVIETVFESCITSTESVSVTTVKLCESLVSIYRAEERWSEAVSCIKKMLVRSWSTFFSESFESVRLAESFSSESIKLVMSLAECYISMKRYEKAEEIYVRLYRCHRNHLKIDDVTVVRYKDQLLKFYARYEMFTKAISFYQELLVEYRAHFGASHDLTIVILYALGNLCRQHSTIYGYWLEYYLEIVVNLNKGDLICREGAFEALLIVAEHYYETLRFSESLVYFKSIFATFCKFASSKKFAGKFKYFEEAAKVKILIEHYFRSIEESKTELSLQIQILKELRAACSTYYEESHEITINVTVTLAETCYRSEGHQFEAISFYELVMKHESTVSKEIVKRTEISLKTLYVKQVTSKKTIVTKETIERATTLLYKLYIEVRRDYHCSHEITLTHLRELVMLYHKQQKLELALKELESVAVDCIIKVSSAKELMEAATSLAAIYVSCGFVAQGVELIREFKLQIIYKSTSRCSQFGFDVTSAGRACFAFVAAFEYHLRAIYSISLTMYMSDLVAEYLFYERLVQSIKTKAELHQVLVCGARLHQILVRTHRVEDFVIIEQKVLQYFISAETVVMKSVSKHSAQVFVNIILGHFSKFSVLKSWTTAVGHAAIDRLKVLLREHKHKEALELTDCTFHFLMAHEGLDDPTEITLGFQLCLMMAGRADDKSLNHKCNDPVIHKGMMDLSRRILAEVFDICKNSNFNLARCQISELNSLIILVGEQRDYVRLQWLLELLWSSREGQTTWPAETVLRLGKRLVQAQFAAGHTTLAIRLCENIVYNVRRVHGVRHHHTASFQDLLASMYITLAVKYVGEAASSEKTNKKHAEEMARVYFKKAVQVHEDVLKQIVNADDADTSDYDDDESEYNDMASNHHGLANGDATCGFAWLSREQEIESVKAHVRRLQLATQRYGGWVKASSNYEALTNRVWGCYGKETAFNLTQDQVLSNKWKIDAYGSGKAEADVEEDGFKVPRDWRILGPEV